MITAGAVERIAARIKAARGETAPDLVLKNGLVADLFTSEFVRMDVALFDGVIVGLGTYDGPRCLDAKDYYVVPGFIDGHFHLESSMLSPREFARAVLPHGTTAVIADPHEITNVLGLRGLSYILHDSEGLPVDFYLMAPSCVPATHLETSGANLAAEDLAALRAERRILGLAEMMNFPGVIYKDPAVLAKLAAFHGAIVDGHAPLL